MNDEELRPSVPSIEGHEKEHDSGHEHVSDRSNIARELSPFNIATSWVFRFVSLGALAFALSAYHEITLHSWMFEENPRQLARLKEYDRNTNVYLKQADVQMDCNRRWENLFNTRMQINSRKSVKGNAPEWTVREYYRQFWSLQSDQFLYYIQGLLPENVFVGWMCERELDFKQNEDLGGVTFAQGFELYGKEIVDLAENFRTIIDFVKSHASAKTCFKAEIVKFMRDYRSEYCNEYKRMDLGCVNVGNEAEKDAGKR